MKHLLFLLISFTAFAQNKAIKIEIDSVTSFDSIPTERIYTIKYHIENLTDKPISFIANTQNLIPINTGSQRHNGYYKLFEEQKPIDMNTIFTNKLFKSKKEYKFYDDKTAEEVEKIAMEEFVKNHWDETNKDLMKSIIMMQPKETKNFTVKLYWNKERYRKEDEFEFYIEEKATHYIEFAVNLLLEEFKEKLTEEEYSAIINDKTFIKGWYTSNKVPIDFSE
ncbi:hypothetical protein QWY90_12665 [Flavobacterium paronense]|uniref:GLPGLI family protein n=1 Tax=Flavobacterium paronense TaxID=1392775 RepID=A0ABV5GEZ3_9FLAO|nr:hypothetical protein [Flavobacterium paronense]MDN3678159.1 hypothetical protein [Flavobacterium paronense]